jgi:hypothetical protein
MKTTKRSASILLSLLMGFSLLLGQEKSDYQIVQEFKSKYQAIQKATEAAASVQDCGSISYSISELEKEYSPYKALLDKALYPDGFDKKIQDARLQLRLAQDKLGVIESQVARIAELRAQVEFLTDQVEKLSGENSNLLKQIQRMSAAKTKETIDSLQNLISQLRSNIRQRDQLIFALVDSLFLQYDKDVNSLKDVEKGNIAGRLEKGNVFTNIKKSIRDNVQFLESTSLTGRDVAEVAKQQRRFEVQWQSFGKKLAAIYASNKKGMNEVAQIDTMLADWGRRTQSMFWRQLNLQFRDRGYAVKEFTNGQEFYQNLSAFIDDEIKNVRAESDDTRYKRYVIFSDSVWNGDVKPNWIPLLIEKGELTDSLNEQLEDKVNSWRKAVQPPQTVMYILIALVLGLIAWFAYKRRQKGKTAPPPAATS